jgi:excinuclease UvrABC ATPase subunit
MVSKKVLTKVVCRRCNGSGKFSFNLTRGTVCFGCEGSGFQMVDLTAEAKKKTTAAGKQEQQAARQELMKSTYYTVVAEMNKELGPFDVDTMLGVDQLNQATALKYGKGLAAIRDERVGKEVHHAG